MNIRLTIAWTLAAIVAIPVVLCIIGIILASLTFIILIILLLAPALLVAPNHELVYKWRDPYDRLKDLNNKFRSH